MQTKITGVITDKYSDLTPDGAIKMVSIPARDARTYLALVREAKDAAIARTAYGTDARAIALDIFTTLEASLVNALSAADGMPTALVPAVPVVTPD